MAYNGWRNRETWLVNLHIMNDYGSYQAWKEFMRQNYRGGGVSARDVEDWVTWMYGMMPIFQSDLARNDMRVIDWNELADSWNTDWRDEYPDEHRMATASLHGFTMSSLPDYTKKNARMMSAGWRCNKCGKEKPDVEERYSFGYYAGRYCDYCWPRSGYRDAADPSATFDPGYAGESLHGEPDVYGYDPPLRGSVGMGTYRNTKTGEILRNVSPEFIKQQNTSIMLTYGTSAEDVGLWVDVEAEAEGRAADRRAIDSAQRALEMSSDDDNDMQCAACGELHRPGTTGTCRSCGGALVEATRMSSVVLEVDYENNGDEFWAYLRDAMPQVARQFENSDTAEVSESDYQHIQKLPGWGGGPAHAPNPLRVVNLSIDYRMSTDSSEMSDDDVIGSRNSLEMIKRPHLWPLGTNLPLQRFVDGEQELGTLRTMQPPYIVTLGVMFFAPGSQEQIEYKSAEDIISDGWMVD